MRGLKGEAGAVTYGFVVSPASGPTTEAGGQATFTVRLTTEQDRTDSIGRIGEFEIHCVIGFGGMGIVFLARDVALDQHVLDAMLAGAGG